MTYIAKLLGTNEQIIFRTRKHFYVIFGAILKELLILLALGIGLFVIYENYPEKSGLILIIFSVAAFLVIISMIIDVIRWSSEEFFVTNQRVIHTSGVFSKNVLDSSLSKINDVALRHSWLGRIFGYGTLKILTASDEVINTLDRISNPIGFKKAMLDAKAGIDHTHVATAAAVSSGSASASQLLDELAQLRARNMITDAEYEEKRKEILKRM